MIPQFITHNTNLYAIGQQVLLIVSSKLEGPQVYSLTRFDCTNIIFLQIFYPLHLDPISSAGG